MKSARFLIVALLPLLAACAASVPNYVWQPGTSYPTAASMPNALSRIPEETFRVSGYVLDAVSRKPVAGVLVEDDYWGEFFKPAQTDANGYFVLHLPVSRRRVVRQLVVRTVFYEGRAVTPADTAQRVTLLLKRNAYRIQPYGCQRPADSVRIPPYVAMPFQGLPGGQIAFLIQDSTVRQPHKVRTLTFRIGRNGFPREPFRVRVYQYSSHQEAPPGKDLLEEDFLICEGKEGVFTYDVSPYDIVVSGTDFFVALEYVTGSDKFYCNDPIPNYTPTGPVLRPPCARADIRTWEYTIGKGWHRATAVENCWPLYESALSVEVEPAPAKR